MLRVNILNSQVGQDKKVSCYTQNNIKKNKIMYLYKKNSYLFIKTTKLNIYFILLPYRVLWVFILSNPSLAETGGKS